MKETRMSSERKVAVITGASQGMGAALGRCPPTLPTARRPSARFPKAWRGSGASTRLSTTPGIFVAKPFTQYTEADYATMVGVNLTSFFHITQLAVAEMEKRHSGHVVQITTSLIEHANSHVPCSPR
jgi:NADP-dependent 3-hydroxy acid dehydrogenase YdfG